MPLEIFGANMQLSGGTANPLDSAAYKDIQDSANKGIGGNAEKYLSAGTDVLQGLMMANPNKGYLSLSDSPQDVLQQGTSRGKKIGGGIGSAAGLALAPILGPLAPALGKLAGELIGGFAGQQRAINEARQLDNAQYSNSEKQKEYLQDMRMSGVINQTNGF